MGSSSPSPTAVLGVVESLAPPGTPLATSEVAAEFDCTERTVYNKLDTLVEDGHLETKKVGARARVWWRPPQTVDDDTPERETEPAEDVEGELLERVLETSPVGIAVVDSSGAVTLANRRAEEILGFSRGALVGQSYRPVWEIRREDGTPVPDADHPVTRALDSGEQVLGFDHRIDAPDGTERWLSSNTAPLLAEDGGVERVVVGIEDVTPLKEQTRELRREVALNDSISEAIPDSLYTFDTAGRFIRWNHRLPEVTGYSDAEIAEMTPLDFIPEEDHELIADAIADVLETRTVRRIESAVVTKDGERIPYEYSGGPVVAADGELLGLTGVGRDISARKRYEEQLRTQRDALVRLDRVNQVIRSVGRSIVEADTREAVERAACESIAASDLYLFAVLGEFSSTYDEFTPRAFAGIGEQYVERVFENEDAPPLREGIGATAARTHEVQAVQHLTDLPYEFWQATAHEHGFRSLAAIPVVFEDVLYGVVAVYSSQPSAFDERERAVLQELGETIGHAINAIERKEALLADTVLELELREDGALAAFFAELFVDGEGTGRIERTVLLDDGDALQYYTVTGADPERVRDALERVQTVESVRELQRDADRETTSFEVRTTGKTMANVLATYGGATTRTTFEDGAVRVLTELPYGADVRQVVDALKGVYPDMEFVSRRTRERRAKTAPELRSAVRDRLTDRQRTVLEAAYAAGFFNWPRDSTGDELAQSLDVSAPTFHKHVRAGEAKIMAALFDDA